MKKFFKALLSEDKSVSAIRLALIFGLALTLIIVGVIILIALQSVNWKLDISLIDKLTYLVFGILSVLVLGKTFSKFAENKPVDTEEKTG